MRSWEIREIHTDERQWPWKIFQGAVVIGFLVANIHFKWGATGLAAGVAGGMVAWYATGIFIALRTRLWPKVRLQEPDNEGQLSSWD